MKRQGFTLIELLIVIAIIGIVAAIAIPNLLTALQKGKQKATMGDMKSIGNAIESYMTDNYFVPQTPGALSGISVNLQPFYIKVLPAVDGWGGAFQYTCGTTTGTSDLYSIFSYGRDRNTEGTWPSNASPYTVSQMDDFAKDIVFSNGTFTYCPRVK
jgi:type II secretion system protein G